MNLLETLEKHFKKDPQRPLIFEIQGDTQKSFSTQEIQEQIQRFRCFFRQQQIQPGDRIALLAPNSALWVSASIAILAEQAVLVPLYSRQSPTELQGILKDCTPRFLLLEVPELLQPLQNLQNLATQQQEGGEGKTLCPIFSLKTAQETQSEVLPALQSSADPHILQTIIYTSGTSGEPKGVMLHQANFTYMLQETQKHLERISGMNGTSRKDIQKFDQVFHFLPFCFAGSLIMLWTQLYRHNPLMLSTQLENLVQEMATAQPHYYLNVPAVLERIRRGVEKRLQERGGVALKLYQHGIRALKDPQSARGFAFFLAQHLVFRKIRNTIGAQLRFLICGSAPLSEETQRWFKLLGIPVYQIYGLTETTAILTIDRPDLAEAGKVGFAIEDCELRLSAEGELLCRGPNLFSGYWKRPQATQEALRDGWFHTGDQAEVDAQGNYRIVGRLKHLLVLQSAHKIAPEPLEEKIKERCPSLEHAVLCGENRPFLALIYTGSPSEAEVQTEIEALNETLPHYKKIRKVWKAPYSFSPENGLLTANQKLRRKQIQDTFQQEIEALYL